MDERCTLRCLESHRQRPQYDEMLPFKAPLLPLNWHDNLHDILLLELAVPILHRRVPLPFHQDLLHQVLLKCYRILYIIL